MHIGVGACVEEGVKKVQVKFSGLGGISEFTIALNMQKFDHFRDLACILGSLGNDCIKIASITISCLKNTPRCAGAFSFSSFTSVLVLVYPEN